MGSSRSCPQLLVAVFLAFTLSYALSPAQATGDVRDTCYREHGSECADYRAYRDTRQAASAPSPDNESTVTGSGSSVHEVASAWIRVSIELSSAVRRAILAVDYGAIASALLSKLLTLFREIAFAILRELRTWFRALIDSSRRGGARLGTTIRPIARSTSHSVRERATLLRKRASTTAWRMVKNGRTQAGTLRATTNESSRRVAAYIAQSRRRWAPLVAAAIERTKAEVTAAAQSAQTTAHREVKSAISTMTEELERERVLDRARTVRVSAQAVARRVASSQGSRHVFSSLAQLRQRWASTIATTTETIAADSRSVEPTARLKVTSAVQAWSNEPEKERMADPSRTSHNPALEAYHTSQVSNKATLSSLFRSLLPFDELARLRHRIRKFLTLALCAVLACITTVGIVRLAWHIYVTYEASATANEFGLRLLGFSGLAQTYAECQGTENTNPFRRSERNRQSHMSCYSPQSEVTRSDASDLSITPVRGMRHQTAAHACEDEEIMFISAGRFSATSCSGPNESAAHDFPQAPTSTPVRPESRARSHAARPSRPLQASGQATVRRAGVLRAEPARAHAQRSGSVDVVVLDGDEAEERGNSFGRLRVSPGNRHRTLRPRARTADSSQLRNEQETSPSTRPPSATGTPVLDTSSIRRRRVTSRLRELTNARRTRGQSPSGDEDENRDRGNTPTSRQNHAAQTITKLGEFAPVAHSVVRKPSPAVPADSDPRARTPIPINPRYRSARQPARGLHAPGGAPTPDDTPAYTRGRSSRLRGQANPASDDSTPVQRLTRGRGHLDRSIFLE